MRVPERVASSGVKVYFLAHYLRGPRGRHGLEPTLNGRLARELALKGVALALASLTPGTVSTHADATGAGTDQCRRVSGTRRSARARAGIGHRSRPKRNGIHIGGRGSPDHRIHVYSLHYRAIEGVDDRWEWNPSLLTLRAALEARFEEELFRLAEGRPKVSPSELPDYLLSHCAPTTGPSLATFVRREATMEQFCELAIHRSLYNVIEADWHTWVLPRLSGLPKAAMVEIQADEYGGGRPGWLHSELFQTTLDELGLDREFAAYVDQIGAPSLAVFNLLSFFGLHRRFRGAVLGNLAVTEIGSSVANRGFGEGLTRLGGSTAARRFFDEHVVADSVHEQIAAHDLCGTFALSSPEETDMVVFGVHATMAVKRAANQVITDLWKRGHSSLRLAPT